MIRTVLLAMLATVAPGSDASFVLTPEVRWQEEPDTEAFCAAARRECPSLVQEGRISGEIGYDELYDSRGMLIGMRLTHGSGCAPLDEKALLDRRDFSLAFRDDSEPDLENVSAELPPGIDPAAIRIVKRRSNSLTINCDEPAEPRLMSHPGDVAGDGAELEEDEEAGPHTGASVEPLTR